ncbi:hypothetical protein [Bradyrhizobium sp. CCBAU 45389]|uniref:hypothetical protein n=1 Tax=Bradyrhizobium sp. CCBAU 45389 TaxID=858429 RepID=UPI0023056DF0|nr:hypothetical protein [Bradyrhizobium sp. CCBAU 45389]MDA9399028.1 hypothetical protein [Bradyrhizobium sp. CCBAU 45389]
MPTRIVLNHSGDTRREFDAADLAELAKAEQRFKKLTGKATRTSPAKSRYFTRASSARARRGGSAEGDWCFAPSARLVPGDVMLAQKIVLETNENAVANEFPPRMPFNR